MKFKGFKEFVVQKVLSDNNYPMYEDVMNRIDSIPLNEDEPGVGSKIANWLFVAPKIKRLMGQANQARLNKVKIEMDRDKNIRTYNEDFEEEIDKTREDWKSEIERLKEKNKEAKNDNFSRKIDKYKSDLADKLKRMKEAHRAEIKDVADAFDRKIEAAEEELSEIEKECDELAGSSLYLQKVKRSIRLKGIIEADKAKMAVASDTEQNVLADKVKRYKKELETVASDIKKAIEDNKNDIAWTEEQ